MPPTPGKVTVKMKLIESLLTKNDCYNANRKIEVKGLMIHSVGCNQPSASVFMNNWNKPGQAVCVHGFIEPDGDVFQCLPWNHRGWHCASGANGSGNNTHLGFEMTEPATIKYVGGATWQETGDGTNTKAHVLATYKTAVELFAYLCGMFGLNPLADGVIISHSEGYKRGIASNHGDVEHLWNKFGLSMAQFRQDIKAAMGLYTPTPETPANDPSDPQMTLYKVQTGAFKVKDNATALEAKLKGAGFDTYIVQVDGLYKVQVGAYSVKANADAMLAKLKAAGYSDAFITGGTSSAGSSAKEIKVGDKVKVLKAETYTGGTFKTYYDTYDVIEVKGDRVVIGIGKTATAAVKASNLQTI